MENYYPVFFPSGSSKPSTNYSSSSRENLMPNPPTPFSGEDGGHEALKAEKLTSIQNLDAIKISQDQATSTGSPSSSDTKKVKNGKRQGDNKKEITKHRYAFQTRSQVDILDDGYRWRKYGQKTVKNSKFPRSYYKCTHNGCNVKKQIQRNSKDEEIVVTTYDGKHMHPTQAFPDNFEHIFRQMQTHSCFKI